jgi:Uma2 family endonuclease
LPIPRRAEQTMGMPQAAELWTAERIRALPEDGLRHEVVDGEHLVSPSPRPIHQIAVGELFRLVDPYVRQHELGRVISSPADLEFDPHTLMQPDLFVTSKRKVKTWKEALPLRLAIEVLSPSTARADRIVKRRRFQRAGVEYWIVDLDARLVERWRPADKRPEVLEDRLLWQPEGAPVPLLLDLDKLFREVEGG